jgi:GNAT superfamily N-acetyltransferase
MAEVTPPRPLFETDDRSHFDCGRDSLNAWFRRHAWQNHGAGISRVSVICNATSGLIVGFVTLSAAQIQRDLLPKPHQRNKPDPVPATLLGQLAVDRSAQGQGHADALMQFALAISLRASREIGSFCVLTHPLDDQVRPFYRRWEFEDLPFDPRGTMIVRMIDLEKSLSALSVE